MDKTSDVIEKPDAVLTLFLVKHISILSFLKICYFYLFPSNRKEEQFCLFPGGLNLI